MTNDAIEQAVSAVLTQDLKTDYNLKIVYIDGEKYTFLIPPPNNVIGLNFEEDAFLISEG